MATVDERVVRMKLEGSQFQSEAKGISKTLDNLKQKLHFKDAGKGLDGVQKSANSLNFQKIMAGIDNLNSKFSTIGVAFMSVTNRLTNMAVDAGQKIAQSIIGPAKDGFAEYELQLNSVQTILSNTQSKGTNIQQVNSALNELNKYADRTIYNFSEMTRNIGTFTAAGVDLDQSVSSIKGMANLAALSGSSSQQASTAMYQLSQAIAAGKVQLMDWNSVVNAGMGGQVFQDALKRTAENFGTDVDSMIKKYGSFRESLTHGEWLTTDVLTETLKQLSGAYTEADLIAKGYNAEQAKEIVKLAETATDAATKVKTFSQLVDTAKEAMGSGWAQTWQYVFGDFEEARDAWTNLSNRINGIIESSANARNSVVKEWADLGGRAELFGTLNDAFDTLLSYINPIKQAFKDVFPPITGQVLYDLTKKIHDFVKGAKLSEEQAKKLHDTLVKMLTPIKNLASSAWDLGVKLFNIAREKLPAIKDGLSGFFAGIQKVIDGAISLKDHISKVVNIGGIFAGVIDIISSGLSGIGRVFSFVGAGLSAFISLISNAGSAGIQSVGNLTGAVGTFASKVVQFLMELVTNLPTIVVQLIKGIGDTVKAVFDYIPIDQIVGTIQDVLYTVILGDIHKFFKRGEKEVKNAQVSIFTRINKVFDDLSGLGDKAGEALDGVTKSLSAMTQSIQANIIVKIAIAVGILAASIYALAKVPLAGLASALGALTIGLGAVAGIGLGWIAALKKMTDDEHGFMELDKAVVTFRKLAVSVLIFAAALRILADAVKELSSVPFDQLMTGLIGLGGIAGIVVAMSKLMKDTKGLGIASATMIAFALAMKILASAVKSFAMLEWDELKRGVLGLASSMAILAVGVKLLDKSSGNLIKAGVATFVMANAITKLASAVGAFKDVEVGDMAKAGASLAGLMGLMAIFKNSISNFSDAKSTAIFIASLYAMTQVLQTLGSAIKAFTDISVETLEKAGVSFAAFLAAYAIVVDHISNNRNSDPGKLAAISGSVNALATALHIFADAVKSLSSLSWEELGVGVTGVAAGLAIMLIALNNMPADSLKQAAGMAILSASIRILVDSIKDLAEISWEGLAKALVGLGVGLGSMVVAMNALNTKGAKKSAKSLLILSVAISMLTGSIRMLAQMTIAELATALVALAGTLFILVKGVSALEKSSNDLPNVAKSLALLGAAMIALGIGLMAIERPIERLAQLEPKQLLVGITGLAAIIVGLKYLIDGVNKLPTLDLKSAATIALLGVVVTGLAIAVGQMAKIDGKQALLSATAISEVLGVTAGALFVLSKVPLVGALQAVGTLAIVIAAMTAIVAAFGGIAQIPGVTWLMGEGANFLKQIGSAIGGFFGGIIGGILGGAIEGVANALPGLGNKLSEFMTNAQKFFTGCEMIDQSSLNSVKILAEMLMQITAAELLSSITAWLTGKDPLDKFGEQLVKFGPQIKKYADSIAGMDSKTVESSAVAAKALGEFANSLPREGGLLQKVIGQQNLGEFAKKLIPFGTAMKLYGDNVKGIDAEAVKNSATAGKAMTDLANSLPREDGLLQKIIGKQDLASFAQKLVQFGGSMALYSNSIKDLDSEAVKKSADAGKAITSLVETLPKTGGWVQKITGIPDLGLFSTNLTKLGAAMLSYSVSVQGIDDTKTKSIKVSVDAIKTLVEVANAIPKTGGWDQIWQGTSDLATFAENIAPLGSKMKSFSDNVKNIGDNAEAIKTATNTIKAIANMANELDTSGVESGWSSLETFASWDKAGELGANVKKFADGIKDLPSIDSNMADSAANIMKVISGIAENLKVEKIKVLAGFLYSKEENIDWSGFGASMEDMGKGINSFVEALQGEKGLSADAIGIAERAAGIIEQLVLIGNKCTYLAPNISNINSVGSIDGKKLGTMVKNFCDGLDGLGNDSVNLAKIAADILGVIADTASDIKDKDLGTALDNFVGSNGKGGTLGDLGDGLSAFVKKLKDSGFSENGAAEKTAAGVIKDIAAAMRDLPDTTPATTLTFGQSLSNLATGIGDFIEKSPDYLDQNKATFAMEFLNSVVETTNKIKDVSDDTVSGIQSLSESLPKLGDSLKQFSDDMDSLNSDESNPNNVGYFKGINQIGSLLNILDSYKDVNLGGIQTVATGMDSLSQAISNFSGTLSGVGGSGGVDFSSMSMGVNFFDSFVAAANKIAQADASGFEKITQLSNTLKAFADVPLQLMCSSWETYVGGIVNGLADLKKAFEDNNTGISDGLATLKSTLTGGNTAFDSTITSTMKTVKDAFISAKSSVVSSLDEMGTGVSTANAKLSGEMDKLKRTFTDKMKAMKDDAISTATGFKKVGEEVSSNYATGIGNKSKDVSNAANKIANAARTALAADPQPPAMSFYMVGANAGQGFVNGLKSKIDSAALAAAEMAKSASDAAKKNLDVNSPSRVFMQIGKFAGDGFAIGMLKSSDTVRDAANSMAVSATNSVNESMRSISDLMEANVEYSPTIRPVVDTSTLRVQNANISAIMARGNGNLRSMNRSVQAIGQVISTNNKLEAYRRDVLDSNSSLLSAVDGLRGDISEYNEINRGIETAMYVDGKKLASSIAKPMNQQLGTLSRRQRLG